MLGVEVIFFNDYVMKETGKGLNKEGIYERNWDSNWQEGICHKLSSLDWCNGKRAY